MRAVVHQGRAGLGGVRVADTAVGGAGPDEVLIRLKAAGLNHRDLFVAANRSPGDAPLVLGADGAGVIAAAGPGSGLTAGTR
ncbi:alcohol dehydrogenase catalytic domain-containing protein [Streptomyces sp. NPDC051018]|uniref:alcohol dehydrogenase catalytic domain-containing protein n=1 Tax=Streptomyces sp. NPDC051018 TaxID=3365639 RepID=UPI003792CD7D